MRAGTPPTVTQYDTYSGQPDNNETVTLPAAAGKYYILLRGVTPFERVQLGAFSQ